MATLQKLWHDQRGQDMTKYSLMGGLLASLTLAIVPEMLSVATHLGDVLRQVALTAIDAATLK